MNTYEETPILLQAVVGIGFQDLLTGHKRVLQRGNSGQLLSHKLKYRGRCMVSQERVLQLI